MPISDYGCNPFKCFKTPKSGSYFILNFVLEVTESGAKSKDQRLEPGRQVLLFK